jgi:hypothetical protein
LVLQVQDWIQHGYAKVELHDLASSVDDDLDLINAQKFDSSFVLNFLCL